MLITDIQGEYKISPNKRTQTDLAYGQAADLSVKMNGCFLNLN